MLLYIFVILSIFLLFFYHCYYKRLGLPPGPMPWPLLGNTLDFLKQNRLENVMIGYRKTYGDVVTFWFGSAPSLVLNSLELAEKYMVKHGDVFADRMELSEVLKMFRGGDNGIVNTSGDLWRSQRRFALKVMRDFGLGKSEMEERVLAEVMVVCEKLNKDIDAGLEEINVREHVNVATGSVINTVVCGESFTAQNKEDEFYKVQAALNALTDNAGDKLAMVALAFPRLMCLPYIGDAGRASIARVRKMWEFIDKKIEEHLANNDYSDQSMEPRDFIDAFMLEKKRLEAIGDTENYFTNEQLSGTAVDLWLAGHETTSSTINWIIAYMITYPEIQAKAQEEIDRVISSPRPITTADRPNLPYVMALLTECQRCANIIGINIPRTTSEDIDIEGYHIKKGTIIFAQVAGIMQDEKIFPSPSTFKSERFIDENGKFINNPAVLPFSLGKRACLGEGLARMELFLFTANLLNQFKILSGKDAPTLKKLHASATPIENFTCRFEKRH